MDPVHFTESHGTIPHQSTAPLNFPLRRLYTYYSSKTNPTMDTTRWQRIEQHDHHAFIVGNRESRRSERRGRSRD